LQYSAMAGTGAGSRNGVAGTWVTLFTLTLLLAEDQAGWAVTRLRWVVAVVRACGLDALHGGFAGDREEK